MNICTDAPVVLTETTKLVSESNVIKLPTPCLHVKMVTTHFFSIFRLGWNLNVLPHLPGSVLKHVGFVQGKMKLQAGKLQRFLMTGHVCLFFF